jgi:hypothetical protein
MEVKLARVPVRTGVKHPRVPVWIELMPGPPLWVQEWYVKPPPRGIWFRVTEEDWVETSPSTWTRRVFAWVTDIQVAVIDGETFAVEVYPVWT